MLQLGAAERVDAVVEMNHPGVWILGTPVEEDRNRGMGIVGNTLGEKAKRNGILPANQIGITSCLLNPNQWLRRMK
jgi:hypothetical protein